MQSYLCPFSEQTMQFYSIPPWKCNGELRPLTDPPHLTRSWWSACHTLRPQAPALPRHAALTTGTDSPPHAAVL